MLNTLKLMGDSILNYTYQALSLKKFYKILPTYMWPMFIHVCPCVNYEWIKIQTKVKKNLINNQLKVK
jgi:hypothetical protein